MDRAVDLYLKQNADQIKPYTITIIRRDSKAPNGAEAKVAAHRLASHVIRHPGALVPRAGAAMH